MWFDFCYRFAVCVKPGYLSPRVLNQRPLGSATDFLSTITAAHPPFFHACPALRVLIDFVSPFGTARRPVL